MNIKLNNINKNKRKKVLLKDINIEFEANKIHGIFGAHNSGKSLLLNIMTRFTKQTSGEVLYNNETYKNKDLSLCYVPDTFVMILQYKYNLQFFTEVFPKFDLDYAYSLIEKFDLQSNIMNVAASSGTLSLMRIIITLASNADILIFDDIIAGLDIFNRNLVYTEILDKFNKDKQTIFIACSFLNEIESILNDFIILDNNTVVKQESINIFDNSFIISGSKENVLKYKNENTLIKTEVDNFVELIVFNKEEFINVEVRKCTLNDLVNVYGGNYEK